MEGDDNRGRRGAARRWPPATTEQPVRLQYVRIPRVVGIPEKVGTPYRRQRGRVPALVVERCLHRRRELDRLLQVVAGGG